MGIRHHCCLWEKSPKSPLGEETPRVDLEVKERLSLLPPGGISGKWAHPSGWGRLLGPDLASDCPRRESHGSRVSFWATQSNSGGRESLRIQILHWFQPYPKEPEDCQAETGVTVLSDLRETTWVNEYSHLSPALSLLSLVSPSLSATLGCAGCRADTARRWGNSSPEITPSPKANP